MGAAVRKGAEMITWICSPLGIEALTLRLIALIGPGEVDDPVGCECLSGRFREALKTIFCNEAEVAQIARCVTQTTVHLSARSVIDLGASI